MLVSTCQQLLIHYGTEGKNEPAQSRSCKHPQEPSDVTLETSMQWYFSHYLKESLEIPVMYVWFLLLPLVFCSLDTLTGIWMMQAPLNASAQIKVRGNVYFNHLFKGN